MRFVRKTWRRKAVAMQPVAVPTKSTGLKELTPDEPRNHNNSESNVATLTL